MGEALHLDRDELHAVRRADDVVHRPAGSVLEYHQRVEQVSVPGVALHGGQADVAVRPQARESALQVPALLEHRAVVETYPQRDGVDEQPDHRFHAGEVVGAPGVRVAEHQVGAVGEPAEHHRPRELGQAC